MENLMRSLAFLDCRHSYRSFVNTLPIALSSVVLLQPPGLFFSLQMSADRKRMIVRSVAISAIEYHFPSLQPIQQPGQSVLVTIAAFPVNQLACITTLEFIGNGGGFGAWPRSAWRPRRRYGPRKRSLVRCSRGLRRAAEDRRRTPLSASSRRGDRDTSAPLGRQRRSGGGGRSAGPALRRAGCSHCSGRSA